jgi:hypothetical protein
VAPPAWLRGQAEEDRGDADHDERKPELGAVVGHQDFAWQRYTLAADGVLP